MLISFVCIRYNLLNACNVRNSIFQVIYEDLPSNLCAIRDYVENLKATQSSEVCEQNTNSGQQIISSGSGVDDGYSSVDDFSGCNAQSSSHQRSRVPGLQRDIEVLKSELLKFIAEHGQEGFMPMRKQLRLHGRVDIEKAITRMGGFRKIATLMNLSLAYKYRKPKGYWDNLENLQDEVGCINSILVVTNQNNKQGYMVKDKCYSSRKDYIA